MNVRIDENWRKRLQEEFDKPYFEQLVTFVKNEYKQAHVLPPGPQIFHIFNACPFEKVKVVILGQDPYPNPGQYYGVCFSVPDGVAIPGSLMNIFKEIYDDLGKPILREFGSLGKPRRISDEFRPHGPCPPNRFAPEQGMGNIHGRRYQEIKRRTGKSSIHVMG